MKLSPDFNKTYPKLAVWIETNLPLVKKKSRVWTAFLKYSELNSTNALSAITPGFFPEINVSVMPGANGQFSGSTSPNKVFLAKSICEKFEKDSTNSKMHILVESTLLHEMVHWGDWQDGKDQAGEEGKAFEVAAYGKDINRYW